MPESPPPTPTREECLVLLAGAWLGRLVYTHRALPDVLPVTYRLDGDQVLIWLPAGSPAVRGTRNSVVAFEVDDFDARARGASGAGWTVTIVGRAREVPGPDGPPGDQPDDRPGDRQVHFAIAAERITGRRLRTESLALPERVESKAEGPYPAGGAAA